MPIRQLERSDLRRIAEIAFHGLEFDTITEALIAEKTVDARDFDPGLGLVHETRGRVDGFAMAAVGRPPQGGDKGNVRLLVVDPAARCQGIGGALLGEAERRLAERGVREVGIMDCPHNYLMPGVDFRYTEAYCFLHKHGYEKTHENHNLICDIDPCLWPQLPVQMASLAAEGLVVRRAEAGDAPAIHALVEAHWPGWHTEVENALANDPVSLHVTFRNGECVAFSGYQGNNRALGWFGPMGTLPDLRGKGVGGLLLRLCLLDLARQGWRTAIIPWVGPTRFYARYAGARLDRCFYAYRKVLAV